MKTFMVLAILAAAAVVQAEIIHDIGGQCGGLGDKAPPGLAADNCWKGYECDHSENLICVRNSQWYWGCETVGSIGPDGKPVMADMCKPTEVAPNNGRKMLAVVADAEQTGDLLVPTSGSCGGTGSQTPAGKTPVDGCWANTRCADANAICIKEDAYGYYYQCLPKGSKNYEGKVVTTDACSK